MSRPKAMRPSRPPAAVVLRPSFVTDENCHAIAGINARKFRERIVPRCRDVTRLGHTAMVPLGEFERVVRELGQCADDAEESEFAKEHDDDQPKSVHDVLARLGRELVR